MLKFEKPKFIGIGSMSKNTDERKEVEKRVEGTFPSLATTKKYDSKDKLL
jgi:hypothetical protein